MNNLVVPPSPNWYESKILTCAVDNTVIYGSRNEIVVINPQPPEQPADIRIISQAHYERIVCVDANPNWKYSKLIVSAGEDKLVKLWNLEKYECHGTHNSHTAIAEKLVGSCFAGSDRVISVSENGFLSIWRFGSKEIIPLKNLFNFKVHITCMSSCMHASWLMAFGLKSGLIVLADIRKTGKILYKLRGHDRSVVALSWCPTPFNIFPKTLPSKNRKIFNVNKEASVDSSKKITESLQSNSDAVKEGEIEKCDSVENNSSSEVEVESHSQIEDCKTDVKKEVQSVNEESQPISKVERETISTTDLLMECEFLKRQIEEQISEENKVKETISSTDCLVKCELPKQENEKSQEISEENEMRETISRTDYLVKCESRKRQHEESQQNKESQEISEESKGGGTDFLMECELLKQQILELADVAGGRKVKSTDVAEGNEHKANSEDLIQLQPELDENLCKSENVVDLISDSELDNEIQEIFQPTREYLLASSARGGSIYIWRAGSDGRIQKELPVGGKSGRKNYRSSDKAWITICWITPEILLSSSVTGELFQWNLLKTNENTSIPQKKLIHHDHRTNLFCIAAPIIVHQVWEEENWQNRKDLHAWTIGQDRFLLNTSLMADRTTLSAYPTIGGFVYCLMSSPVDPCRIAVGIGDNTAKVWDLSRPHLQCILMSNLWQKIQSKVLTLAWHPSKEMSLAYGTYEGRIGIINTNNLSKMPVLLCQYFRTSVYNIEWGPIKGNVEEVGLYACGEGKLVFYNSEKPMEDPILIDTPAKEYVTHMSWKPNYSVLAVATRSGAIVLYDSCLKHLMTIYSEHKTIQTLLWHPEATAEDSESSPYAFWLATGTNNASIPVYNLSGLQNEDKEIARYEMVAVLTGHTKPVKKLAWSSYESGKLASCGEDGIVYIWDVKTKTILSMYIQDNFDPIMSILWSPLDKNYIIVGGKDQTIRIWNILEHPPKSKEEVSELLLKVRGKMRAELTKRLPKDEGSDDEEPKKVKRDQMLHCMSKIQHGSADALIEDCRRLLDKSAIKEESQAEKEIDVLKLFGDRESMISLLEAEQKRHEEAGRAMRSQHLSLWNGNLAETIKEAIKQGNVTPWLISMAPMVSPKLWQETCEAYAKKLTEDSKSDPLETASYLLACHKVEDAIRNLCDATLYREALAIAKCRLPSSDPIINDVVQKWATYNIVCGSYEVAAQCFIYLEQYEEAAKALFKRSCPKVLEFAVELAERSGNKDLLEAVMTRYNSFKVNEEKAENPTSNEEQTFQPPKDEKMSSGDHDLLIEQDPLKVESTRKEIGPDGDGGSQELELVDKLNLLDLHVPETEEATNEKGFCMKIITKTSPEETSIIASTESNSEIQKTDIEKDP